MIIDELNEFADGVDASGGAGTALIGDVIDLGATPQDFGNGEPMYVVIQQDADAAGGTSAEFKVFTDADVAVTDGSLHMSSGAIATATLVAGHTTIMALPPGGGALAYERYLGIGVTRVGTYTTLTVSAFLTKDPSKWTSLPDAAN